MKPLLSIRDLSVEFLTERGTIRAVRDLTFDISPGETVALVGESGSGKSTAAMAILQLIGQPPGRVAGGRIQFEGRDLLTAPSEALRSIRGSSIAMIFQDPLVALNPIRSIGEQLLEVLRTHPLPDCQPSVSVVIDALRRVGMPEPERQAALYPHNLSGGMLQRAMIAMALLCKPQLLIADEPTTALDVTVQAQVLGLLNAMRRESGMAVLLITHDFGVVAETADHVVVMYAGRKVEEGPVGEIFAAPRHPYAAGLLRASQWAPDEDGPLPEITGAVPSPLAMPKGCSFAPRCAYAMDRCLEEQPPFRRVGERHNVACFFEGRLA